ncbi:unnamed protein product [Angiostrongylus costaricensis]|uniref:Cytochrome c oxidase copper chaperone n=1 Tax=Angiostrongylus costaricensis TaxID=334426 RepID=A0A0R3PQQ8_ANGCS|nr:unnamed protein product [Angiostrongylus costaricensis]
MNSLLILSFSCCARDQCIVENGEEHCGELIEAHKQCMKKAGFDI